MLLYEIKPLLEIAADYTTHKQPDGSEVYEFIPRLDDSVKVSVGEIKNIISSFTKEELTELDDVCHETGRYPHVFNMGILSTYFIESSSDATVKQLQDALKRRKPKAKESNPSFISNDNWNNMVVRAIEEIKNPKFAKGTKNTSLIKELSEIFNTIDSSWNIAYLASSSRVPKEIANILSKKTGARVISRVFKKSTPNLSKWIVGGPDDGKPRDPSVLNSTLNPSFTKLKQQSKIGLYNQKMRYGDSSNDTQTLRKTQKATAKQFEIKNYPRMVMKDGVRGLYGIQKVDRNHRVLDNKPLIIVDDNYQSNRSIIDAIKSLYKAGVFPTEILLFCPHKMLNTGKQQDLTHTTNPTNNINDTSLNVNPIDKNWDNIPFGNVPVNIINDMVDSLVNYNFKISRIVSEYETTYDRTALMSAIINNLPINYIIPQKEYITILSELIGYMKVILQIPTTDIENQISHKEYSQNWYNYISNIAKCYKVNHSIAPHFHEPPIGNSIKNIPQQDRDIINNLVDQGMTPLKIEKTLGNSQYTTTQIRSLVASRRKALNAHTKTNQDQTTQDQTTQVMSLLKNGASVKDIQKIYPDLTQGAIYKIKYTNDHVPTKITNTPISVLKQAHVMSVNGYTNQQIADKLGIAPHTANNWSIYGKRGKTIKLDK